MYDIIPDIHGDLDRLTRTLKKLGYQLKSAALPTPSAQGRWNPPTGRKAAFLGDIIDGGRENGAVIKIVRDMVDAGDAVAVMGNHELNAILYHSAGQSAGEGQDGWMRKHSEKNSRQHKTFLEEFPQGHPRTTEILNWFLSLPLFLDLKEIRIVHACWSVQTIERITERRSDGRLQQEDLQEIALELSLFSQAVINTVKGPEVMLPGDYSFCDYHGYERKHVRLKWWQSGDKQTWRSAALSVRNPEELPDTPVCEHGAIDFYPPDDPPAFFGHYKMTGNPDCLVSPSLNARCLDWPDHPVAWRHGQGLVHI